MYLLPNASYRRLYSEYKNYGKLVIGFDFDGTVYDYHGTGGTFYDVIALLKRLKAIGCDLICWTAHPDLKHVEEYIKEKEIPCDGINTDGIPLKWTSRKAFFSALLDDRAGLIQVYQELTQLCETIELENAT